MMKNTRFGPAVLAGFLLLTPALGDEPAPKRGLDKYAALSRLIQEGVMTRLPKVFADDSGWGRTIPIPPRLRRHNLRRTTVQVGDHVELPHGTWRKVRAWFDDPARDLRIHVRDLHKTKSGSYRLALDADASLRFEADVRQWLRGLLLADINGRADADVTVSLAFDVKVKLAGKLPPEVTVTPRLTELKTDLHRFTPRQVTFRRAGVQVEGEALEKAGDDLKDTLQELIRAGEPQAIDLVNEAITRTLRDGKGTFSAAALLKAVPGQQK
jgi:hypothetical protein